MALKVCSTCFFILGLISSTPLGAEVLVDYGWEATLSPLGLPTGVVIPAALDKFLAVSFFLSFLPPFMTFCARRYLLG